jgi:hypothetical protein
MLKLFNTSLYILYLYFSILQLAFVLFLYQVANRFVPFIIHRLPLGQPLLRLGNLFIDLYVAAFVVELCDSWQAGCVYGAAFRCKDRIFWNLRSEGEACLQHGAIAFQR